MSTKNIVVRAERFSSLTLPPNHPLITILDKLNILFLTYNIIYIPLALAWTCFMKAPAAVAISYIGDLILICSELLHLVTQFEHEFGEIETNQREITRRYFLEKNGFVKFFAMIPYEIIPLSMGAATCLDNYENATNILVIGYIFLI